MNTQKISLAQNTSFGATVKINAPENLIKQAEKAYFESLGPKIGSATDIFEVTISDLHPSKFDSSTLLYSCTQNYKQLKNGEYHSNKSHIDIPYIKDGKTMDAKSPLSFLKRIFDRKINN